MDEDRLKRIQRLRNIRSLREAKSSEPQVQENQPKNYEKGAEPWYEDFAEGAVSSVLDTAYGLKDLTVGLNDEDKALLKDWKDDAGQSGWGTAGRAAGEIGQFAIGGGVGGAALKGLSKVSKLKKAIDVIRGGGKLARTVRAMSPGVAIDAVRVPDEGDTRTGNVTRGLIADAAMGGIVSPLAKAVGKGTKAVLSGLTKSKQGQKALEAGIPLTPSGFSDSGIVRGAEAIAGYIPGLAPKVNRARREAEEGYSDYLRQSVKVPGFPKTTKKGVDAFIETADNIKTGYDNLWKGVEGFDKEAAGVLSKRLEAGKELFNPEEANVLKKVERAIENIGDNPSGEQLQAIDRVFRKNKTAQRKNADLFKELEDLQSIFRKGLPKKAQGKLKEMDEMYPKYKMLEKANKTAISSNPKHTISPTMMKNASKSNLSDLKTGMMQSPMQDAIDMGVTTVGRTKAVAPFVTGIRSAISKAADETGRPLNDSILYTLSKGDYFPQKVAKRLIEGGELKASELAAALRKMGLGDLANKYAYSHAGADELNKEYEDVKREDFTRKR